MAAIKISAWRRDVGQISRAAVADRHGGVGVGAALGEHQRNWFTDDFAAPEHHHVATGGFDVVVHQQLLNPLGRAGQEPRPPWMSRPTFSG